jgi:hypothetical protein
MALSNGKYFSNVMTGSCFIGSTAAAGTTFPLSTGTAMTFGLWNVTTDKAAVLLKLNAGFTSGTIALGEIGLTDLTTPSWTIATGGPITAFTDGVAGTTIRNCMIGLGGPSMRFTPSAATITAGTAYYWTGSSVEGATGVGPRSTISHDFDGAVVVLPGHAAFVTGSIAQTALYSMSLVWQEIPY